MNYKDKTIAKLCTMINYLDACGGMTEDDVKLYREIIANYTAEKAAEETLDKVLPDGYAHYSNCYILRNIEDSEIVIKGYDNDKSEVMMRDVSEHICFSDCDDTWEVIKIVYQGREVEYNGWRPGMVMSYSYKATGDLAWEKSFPHWEH